MVPDAPTGQVVGRRYGGHGHDGPLNARTPPIIGGIPVDRANNAVSP